MARSILYVERRPNKFVSLEKAFREIASSLTERYSTAFQQLPFSSRVYDLIRNLLFFKAPPADIYHVTGHVNFIALRLPPERTVLSIMDCRFVHMNSGLKRLLLKKLYLDLPVRRLRYVTAISEKVREEIIELTGCSPDKVRVLDLPLLSHFNDGARKEFNSEKPTILQVGTMENKNIPNLAKALSGISCKLVIIGELSEAQLNALSSAGIEYENLIGITDEELQDVYGSADLVAFCSTYEGFGLPIIEAQAMVKPVVTSNLSPMTETAGTAACFVDPFDPRSMRKGFSMVIEDPSYREQLVRFGIENVKRFQPSTVGKQYEVLYDEMLNAIDANGQ